MFMICQHFWQMNCLSKRYYDPSYPKHFQTKHPQHLLLKTDHFLRINENKNSF